MKTTSLILLMVPAILFGCMDSEALLDVGLVRNTPVNTNVQGAFTYVVSADKLSDALTMNLQFDTTFVLSMTVANYSSGSFSLAIIGADSTEVYSRVVSSNAIFTDFPPFRPEQLRMEIEDFSGMVDLVLAEEE